MYCDSEDNNTNKQHRKNFISNNEGFVCEFCSTQVPPAKSTCRNHCTQCLTSKHVDANIPGDRASTCHGLMHTTRVEGADPDKLNLVQQCEKCKKTHRNRIASDDNKEKIFRCMQ